MQGCPTFFQFGPNFISSQFVGPQKAVHAESCFNFLIFVPKFRCSPKKNVFTQNFAPNSYFFPNFRCSLKNKGFHSESGSDLLLFL